MVANGIGGLVGLEQEIARRILALVPSLYSSDRWTYWDSRDESGENSGGPPLLFRRFTIDLGDLDVGLFAGGYNHENTQSQAQIVLAYSEAGLSRTLGNGDINFSAFVGSDVLDVERAVRAPIILTDGTTGRLVRSGGARVDTRETASGAVLAEVTVSFSLHAFTLAAPVVTVPRWSN